MSRILSGMKPLVNVGEFPFRLLLLLVFLRTIDLVWVKSTYVPDEYWQSLEVAHNKVFGYGYLTWEWIEGIRSYVYVGLISLVYAFLKTFELESPELIILAPRILQGIISAISDVYFIRWVHEKRNGQYSWAFISWFTTFFVSYCSTRTLINTFEMNLTIIALYYYPWTPKTNNFPFVSIVTLLCFVRPTAGVIWLPLILINILSVRKPVTYALMSYVPNLILVGGACVALDSYMHGSLVVTPWNFFKINVLKDIGSFYGTHDPLWYLYCGIPVVLGLQTLPFSVGCFRLAGSRLSNVKYNLESQMFITIVWSLIVYSFLPHKEFRFILPLAPMMIYISSGVLSKWSSTASYSLLYFIGVVMITVHTGALIFLGQFHQTGQLEAMEKLSLAAQNQTDMKIHFLTPCHSFPGYSHLHANVSTKYLNCDPNLDGAPDFVTEDELFFNNSRAWAEREYSTLRPCTLPTHIVTFDSVNITNFLYLRNFTRIQRISHAEYFPDDKQGKFVHIYKRRGARCA
uniref:Mannosyltransferase n=1 Tax=Lygus hesperus TaxID=30085 RepID=A0A0A9XRR6_LYGHE